jgi:3-hydroxyacyl-CoA dehydrogenase / 3-hydroxy-2-methylbutyryl-CoA dehydrogenase
MDFPKCKALVTGGASGLGEATVRAIIAAGGRAAILDLDDSRGKKLASDLGDNSLFIKTDVSSTESVTKAIEQATAIFGQINVVVNCAGIAPAAKVLGKQGPHDLELFSRALQVNLVGTFNVIRLAAAKIAENEPGPDGERGVIINTASVAAFEGQIGQAAYSASKAGIVGLTLPVARELAPLGIRVVTIAPGIMETPMLMGMPDNVREALGKMVPFPQRLGHPEEYAMLARQIIENIMLNGTTIRLDGAIRMQPK